MGVQVIKAHLSHWAHVGHLWFDWWLLTVVQGFEHVWMSLRVHSENAEERRKCLFPFKRCVLWESHSLCPICSWGLMHTCCLKSNNLAAVLLVSLCSYLSLYTYNLMLIFVWNKLFTDKMFRRSRFYVNILFVYIHLLVSHILPRCRCFCFNFIY